MTIKKELCLELRKLRHRHVLVLFLMTFVLIFAWMCWCLKDMDSSKTNDIFAVIFMNLLLMNTILCPIVIAALASHVRYGTIRKYLQVALYHPEARTYLSGQGHGWKRCFSRIQPDADHSVRSSGSPLRNCLHEFQQVRKCPWATCSCLFCHLYCLSDCDNSVWRMDDEEAKRCRLNHQFSKKARVQHSPRMLNSQLLLISDRTICI